MKEPPNKPMETDVRFAPAVHRQIVRQTARNCRSYGIEAAALLLSASVRWRGKEASQAQPWYQATLRARQI